MNYYIGVDLGTSSMKLLLVDGEGNIYNTVTKEYPLEFPAPGWSQQNPEGVAFAIRDSMEVIWALDIPACKELFAQMV